MNKTCLESTLNWKGRIVRLSYHPRYFQISQLAHVELESVDGAPMPISETGYRSHFFHAIEPPSLKEVEAFALDWLNEEAKSKDWKDYLARSRQMELF